jgi:hypothetical protein
VLQICCPEPFTLKVPLAKLAFPATPTVPTSLSSQPEAKPVAANTVKPSVMECVKPPDAPVTVTVAIPVVAMLLAIRVNVGEPVVGFGLNSAVTPLGRPVIEKVTLPLKPFCCVTLIVVAPPPPCEIPTLLGDAESAKFGPGVTVTETAAV